MDYINVALIDLSNLYVMCQNKTINSKNIKEERVVEELLKNISKKREEILYLFKQYADVPKPLVKECSNESLNRIRCLRNEVVFVTREKEFIQSNRQTGDEEIKREKIYFMDRAVERLQQELFKIEIFIDALSRLN